MKATITREVAVVQTPRLLQMSGIFDLPPGERSSESWDVDLDLPEAWNVGVIVGPSGCGKSTIARELFNSQLVTGWDWPEDKCVLDGFPAGMSIKDITGLLSSVGFSSPPAWVRPFRVLSNGQQFRVTLARTLAELPDLAVVDEFTSVVDRTVAQIGSAAVAKTVRRRNQKFIAVTCHYDVLDWLEPDWVYEPHTGKLARGRLHRRPPIELEIVRVHPTAWSIFKPHHYLTAKLHPTARCYAASIDGRLVAFDSYVSAFGFKQTVRGHRSVVLPDFQGVGIGTALIRFMSAAFKSLGWRVFQVSAHPGLIRHKMSHPELWRCHRRASLGARDKLKASSAGIQADVLRSARSRATDRLTAGFEYIGPGIDPVEAAQLIG